MKHGIGVKFTAVTDLHVVVDHDTGVKDAVGSNTAAGSDADPGGNGSAGTHHGPLIDHGRGMNLSLRALTRMQAVECFGEGQTWIRHHGKGDPPLTRQVDQILLIRQQQRPNAAFSQRCRQGIALLQEAELICCSLLQEAAPLSRGSAPG